MLPCLGAIRNSRITDVTSKPMNSKAYFMVAILLIQDGKNAKLLLRLVTPAGFNECAHVLQWARLEEVLRDLLNSWIAFSSCASQSFKKWV
jgi:hypothetical protein